MVTFSVDQRSDKWDQLRLFVPTASDLHRVVCPEMGRGFHCAACGSVQPRKRKTCAGCGAKEIIETAIVKPSAQQTGYMCQLIAQSILGSPQGPEPTVWMERGTNLEDAAKRDYEWDTGRTITKIGFCTTDDGLIGCSPDGLVGDDGLYEGKAPSPAVHVRHLIEGDLESSHFVQVQGQLMVTGRSWCDIHSFCPGMPSIVIRVERDAHFISGMNEILVSFIERLHRTRAELLAKYGELNTSRVSPPSSEFEAFMRPVC